MSSSNVSVLKLGDEAPKIRLFLRDRKEDESYQYPLESEEVNCAVRAVSVCRAILKAELVGHFLSESTKLYGAKSPEKRFHDSVLIAKQTDNFILTFSRDFPRLYVDDSITNSLVLRRHVEKSRIAEFKPSDHRIYLNGENFRSMCSAATESKYSPDSENWWFLFANFLFREITHFFLDTYLPNGQNIRLSSSDLTSSLALLDKHLFGGVLSFSHDPNLNTCNKIVPLLTYENAKYRILWTSIEETLRENVYLPYATHGRSEDGRAVLPENRLLRAYFSVLSRTRPDSTPDAQAAEGEDKLDTKAKGKQSKQRTA